MRHRGDDTTWAGSVVRRLERDANRVKVLARSCILEGDKRGLLAAVIVAAVLIGYDTPFWRSLAPDTDAAYWQGLLGVVQAGEVLIVLAALTVGVWHAASTGRRPPARSYTTLVLNTAVALFLLEGVSIVGPTAIPALAQAMRDRPHEYAAAAVLVLPVVVAAAVLAVRGLRKVNRDRPQRARLTQLGAIASPGTRPGTPWSSPR